MANSRNNLFTDLSVEEVGKQFIDMLPQSSRVAIAFSGGLDSRVLLHAIVCAKQSKQSPLLLSAVHIDHGISAKSAHWAEFCVQTCQSASIPLEIIKLDIPRNTGEGLEQAARRLRYQALDVLAVDHVMLAQHQNDQAETVLMNLLRGSGVRGAAGMQVYSGVEGRYIRPFLHLSRTKLEAYARKHALDWIEDESNLDTRFTRNFIRQHVLPRLEMRFPNASRQLSNAAVHFAEAQTLLDDLAKLDLESYQAFPCPVAILARLSESRRVNAIRYLLWVNGLQPPPASQMNETIRQFIEAAPDRHPELRLPKYRLFRQKKWVHLAVFSADEPLM